MAKSKVHPAAKSAKHNEVREAAMHEADAHTIGEDMNETVDPVPPAENGSHSRSAAAHLKTPGSPHTKPEGNLRQGSNPGALREPPMVIQRIGKQHRD
jgi:hypothetical protein